LQEWAVAPEQVFQERFEAARAFDRFIYLFDLAVRQCSPAGTNRGPVAQAGEEDFDFGKGKAHIAGEADQEHSVEGVAGIAPLATRAMGRVENAHFFVISNGGCFEAGAAGNVPNFHFPLAANQSDLRTAIAT
jgi:hypothetical protein